MVDKCLVEVVTTKVCITIGTDYAKYPISYFQHGNVKRATTKVEDSNFLLAFTLKTVGQCSRSWLIDNSHDFKTRNLPSVFRGLSLRVVKVCRHRNDCLVNLMAKVAFCRLLERPQDRGGYFWRREFLIANLHLDIIFRSADNVIRHNFFFTCHLIVTTSHKSLNRINCSRWVRHCLPPCDITNECFTFIVEGHNARSEAVALFICDDLRFLSFHDCNN